MLCKADSLTLEKAKGRTWLEVDENALLSNYHEAKSLCHEGTTFIAVLKADAYGFGARQVARLLWNDGARHFSVACIEEALELRDELPEAWILNMGFTPTSQIKTAIENKIRMTAGNAWEMKAFSDEAVKLHQTAIIHIKVDTGLHRLGFIDQEFVSLLSLPGISVEGLYSHLALRSREQSIEQHKCFQNIIDSLSAQGIQFPMYHLLDSIGLERYNDWQTNAARVGAFLYGNVPPDYIHFDRRQAVARFCTRVTRVALIRAGEGIGYDDEPLKQAACVATLAVGYVDGYARVLSGVGEVLIRGKRAKVLGLICMDQMMVDVTDIPETECGDEAVLLGDSITLNEYAAWGHMNRNEVTSIIGRRVPRIYMRDGKAIEILNRIE